MLTDDFHVSQISNAAHTQSDGATNTTPPQDVSHLLRLTDSSWSLWRWAALRGAGFPAQQVLALASPDIALRADQYIQGSATQQQSEREKLQNIFATTQLQISHTLQEIIHTPRFQEAVLWQNCHAFHTGIAPLLHTLPENTRHLSKKRQHEILAARYLQRYCMKNDTIGFFGPVGWVSLIDDAISIVAQPGASLLCMRQVYFEQWGIDALGRAISHTHALRPWLVPHCMPHLRLENSTLHFPFGRTLALNQVEASVLDVCDGRHTARQIAALIEKNTGGIKQEEDVYQILEQFKSMHYITWELAVSPEGVFPEQLLRQQLEAIENEDIRTKSLGMLATLERARDAVTIACGNAEQLDSALGKLNSTFSHITEMTATRSDGQTYAARTLVYEDCRRDIDVRLGADFINTLGEPLSLLLTSARWFTYQLANLYREAILQSYQELVSQMRTPRLDLATFWLWLQPLLFNEKEPLSQKITPLFQQKWSEIFMGATDSTRDNSGFHYSSKALRAQINKVFAVPGPGWSSACYHAPDIFIQASSVEAICQDDYQLILGEFHMAINTLQAQLFVAQHPSPQDLLSNTIADLPEPRILSVIGKEALPVSRTRPCLIAPKDIRIAFTGDATVTKGTQVLPVSAFTVEQSGQTLVVNTRDGHWSFDIIEVVAEILSEIATDCFQLRAQEKHLQRVTIDRLVVAREAWSFLPSEIDFLSEKISPLDCFLVARRWMHANRLPRFVFFKTPGEPKPCFLDFESPLYIEIFRRTVRRMVHESQEATPVLISEMLPTPEQLWLTDAIGNRYTSEIRLVAVDQMKKPHTTLQPSKG